MVGRFDAGLEPGAGARGGPQRFDMMRAAGYDPRRSARCSRSCSARRRDAASGCRRCSASPSAVRAARQGEDDDGPIAEVKLKVKAKAEELAVEAVFRQLTESTANYDPPQRRQQLLAEYADKQAVRAIVIRASPTFLAARQAPAARCWRQTGQPSRRSPR